MDNNNVVKFRTEISEIVEKGAKRASKRQVKRYASLVVAGALFGVSVYFNFAVSSENRLLADALVEARLLAAENHELSQALFAEWDKQDANERAPVLSDI